MKKSEEFTMERRELFRMLGGAALGSAFLSAGGALMPGLQAKALANADWRLSGKDLITALHERRSCRFFDKKPLPEADLKEILFSGMNAPSTHDVRPWHFIVADKIEMLDRLVKINSKAAFMSAAGAVVVVCLDKATQLTEENSRESLLFSVACSVMNMWLTADALGYGTVWVEVMPDTDRMAAVKDLFKLPAHIDPVCFLPIGKPASKGGANLRFEAERVHMNGW